jgi:hypothetical protein
MKTPADHGSASESRTANRLNEYYAVEGLSFRATAEGGSSKNSDIKVVNTETDSTVFSIEDKNTNSSRTDYGQFTIAYDKSAGWTQATGLNNPVLVQIFSVMKPELDKEWWGEIPTGQRLNEAEARQFWECFEPGRGRSLKSGQIKTIPIHPAHIDAYYKDKGDSYIKIGDHVYGLTEDAQLPSLSSMTTQAYAVFRMKYHKRNHHSYTVALRLNCHGDDTTSFDSAKRKLHLNG